VSDANASGAQSAAEIERDLDRRRARLNQDLNALEDRMSPNQLIDQAAAYLRSGQGAAFTRNLGTSVRDNPIPAVLVGVGLAWLMASGGGSSSSRPATRGYPQARPSRRGPTTCTSVPITRAMTSSACRMRARNRTARAWTRRGGRCSG